MSRLTRLFQNKILESCWYFYIVIALNDRVKPSKSKNGSNSILTKSGHTRFFQITCYVPGGFFPTGDIFPGGIFVQGGFSHGGLLGYGGFFPGAGDVFFPTWRKACLE
jgi:hypothetical protein